MLDLYAARLAAAPVEEGAASADTRWLVERLHETRPVVVARPRREPVHKHWESALALTARQGDEDFADALRAIGPSLRWFEHAPDSDYGRQGEAFLENVAFGLVVGSADLHPISPSEDYAFGVLLMGPNSLYPLHRHRAREVYYVVGGRAEWTRGGEAWRVRPPASLIHHAADMPHATRTGDEPLVALAAWVSDLDSIPTMVND